MWNRSPWFWVVACALTLGGNAAVWFGTFPLGVPGEWDWARRAAEHLAVSVTLLAIWGLVLAGFIAVGASRLKSCTRVETGLWLAGLVVAGFAWLWALQDAAPFPTGLRKAAWVLYYPGSSGYFTEARYRVHDLERYLAGYEREMSQGDVLHIGTHPPGLVVGYRGLLWLCDRSPAFAAFLRSTQPAELQESFAEIADRSHLPGMPLLDRDRSVLWLAALVVQLIAVLAVVPLYLLLRRTESRATSWLTASLWILVPAVAVFLPKSDTLFPFLGMCFLFLWLEGWTRRSWWMCLLSGVVLWLGLFLSLALLPVLFLALLLTIWEGWICRDEPRQPFPLGRLCFAVLWCFAGFAVPVACLWGTTGMNLISVWSWNYRNHAAFYGQFPRTYWKWLLVNPIELAIAAGIPLACLAISSARSAVETPTSRRAGILWACLTAWGCLWLSGKNMGEAARLWIVLMPWLVWMAADAFRVTDEPNAGSSRTISFAAIPRDWWVGWCLQWSAAIVIVLRVSGFLLPAG